jgi:hypothetical protein
MPGYVAQALKEFEHATPTSHYTAPSKIERPDYGVKVQYVKEDLTNNGSQENFSSTPGLLTTPCYIPSMTLPQPLCMVQNKH